MSAANKRVYMVDGVAKSPHPYYADAVETTGRLLFISGQGGLTVDWQLAGPGDIRAQTRQAIENIRTILRAAGGDLENVVSVVVYTTDISLFKEIADVRNEMFGNSQHSSTLIEVSKINAPYALIEIAATAVL